MQNPQQNQLTEVVNVVNMSKNWSECPPSLDQYTRAAEAIETVRALEIYQRRIMDTLAHLRGQLERNLETVRVTTH